MLYKSINTTPHKMYTVVYGDDWDQFMYFSDFHSAKRQLLIQTFLRKEGSFLPKMHEIKTDTNNHQYY